MRYFLSIVCLLGLLSNYVSGQLSVGPTVSINSSMIQEGTNLPDANLTGGGIGLFIEKSTDSPIIFHLSASYALKGESYNLQEGQKAITRLGYIQTTGLLKIKLPSNDEYDSAYLGIGPYLGLPLHGRSILEVNGQRTTVSNDLQMKLDTGISLAFGARFENFMFEIRYDLGLSNTFEQVESRNEVLSGVFYIPIIRQ